MKVIKILTFGNSYSSDSYAWLYQIFKSAGYEDVVLGHICNGGCNINNHWSNVDDDTENDYDACCYVDDNEASIGYTPSESLREAYKLTISAYEWDYVVIQHGPSHVEKRETYSHLRDLIDFIKDNLTSTKTKFIYHMIWKYNDNVEGGSTAAVYNEILDITNNLVLKNKEFVGVIPSATMRQNMMSSYLTDKEISRDYGHMSLGFGRYALGLLWYCYLTGGTPSDVSFIPKEEDIAPALLEKFSFDVITEKKLEIAREAIENALAHPYEITKSNYKQSEEKVIEMEALNIDEQIAAVGGEHLE